MKNKITATMLALFVSMQACAGWNGTTSHSRANCGGINESITWNAHKSYTWRVVGIHFPNKNSPANAHDINTGWSVTWRQAAIHWTESYGGNYLVRGFHFYWDYEQGREVFNMVTEATDCNIYDGWWDI